jgi:hypothetical protein
MVSLLLEQQLDVKVHWGVANDRPASGWQRM